MAGPGTPKDCENTSTVRSKSRKSRSGSDHIQFAEILMSPMSVTRAKTRFVSASPTEMRAMAAGSIIVLIGCSPSEIAVPVTLM